MKYYSTNNKSTQATLQEAVVKGLASDRGLYMPEVIKSLPDSFFEEMKDLSFKEVAYVVADAFFGEDVEAEDLKKIVYETLNFDVPLVHVNDNIYSLELFHGPTLAFKDVGARFMSRLLGYFIKKEGQKDVNVLVATSGDTGSAVANGFLGVDGIHVYVLYPKGKVSPSINKGLFAFMGNHEYDVPVDDADAITEATLRARREIFNMTDALVSKGGDAWKGLRIVFSAERLWHRRARRLHGKYTLTLEDCFAGRKFEDALCTCSFGIDLHAVSKAMNKKVPAGSPIARRIKPYQIPLRSCQSRDIDNLYMAGRCISGDFMPQSSYRITGTAIGMGVGVAEAICKNLGC